MEASLDQEGAESSTSNEDFHRKSPNSIRRLLNIETQSNILKNDHFL